MLVAGLTLDELEVWREGRFENRSPEHGPIGDLGCQKLDHNIQFVDLAVS
jgi:hypothetical protein